MSQMQLFLPAKGINLVLASSSPRRRELLASLGLPFTIFNPQNCEPLPTPGQTPEQFARSAALAKGRAALKQIPNTAHSIIISADTVVCADGLILGKPSGHEEALTMLSRLNGKTHRVVTAFYLALPICPSQDIATCPGKNDSVCLEPEHTEILGHSASEVSFGQWPESVLEVYARSGECDDKAGAYAIQGRGAFLITSISGSWTNVVGLPLSPIVAALMEKKLIIPCSTPNFPVPDDWEK